MKAKFNNAVGPQVRAEKTDLGKFIRALAAISMGSSLQTANYFYAPRSSLLALAITKMFSVNTALKDIQTAGLLPDKRIEGVYGGSWLDKSGHQIYWRHNGSEYIPCYVPMRAGKSVCLVNPMLFSLMGNSRGRSR